MAVWSGETLVEDADLFDPHYRETVSGAMIAWVVGNDPGAVVSISDESSIKIRSGGVTDVLMASPDYQITVIANDKYIEPIAERHYDMETRSLQWCLRDWYVKAGNTSPGASMIPILQTAENLGIPHSVFSPGKDVFKQITDDLYGEHGPPQAITAAPYDDGCGDLSDPPPWVLYEGAYEGPLKEPEEEKAPPRNAPDVLRLLVGLNDDSIETLGKLIAEISPEVGAILHSSLTRHLPGAVHIHGGR